MTSADPKQVYPPGLPLSVIPRRLGGTILLPLALLLVAVLGSAAAEIFGPPAALLVFGNLDVAFPRGQMAILVGFLMAVTMHEAGHFTAAFLSGFKILGFAVGPLRLSHLHGRYTLSLVPRNLFSGAVSAIPMDDRWWRARMLAVVAAGPAASLLLGGLAIHFLPLLEPGSRLAPVLSAVAALNLMVFFVGLVPNGRHARTKNDSQLFLGLLRNGREAREIQLYHQFMRLKVEGVRPRDYPLELVHKMAESEGRPDICLAFADALMKWAIDDGNLYTADAWRQRAMQLLATPATGIHNIARAESACFDLLFRYDSQSARDKFSAVKFREISPAWLRHRMLASARMVEGNAPAALGYVEKALASLPRDVPYAQFERTLLNRLIEHNAQPHFGD